MLDVFNILYVPEVSKFRNSNYVKDQKSVYSIYYKCVLIIARLVPDMYLIILRLHWQLYRIDYCNKALCASFALVYYADEHKTNWSLWIYQ